MAYKVVDWALVRALMPSRLIALNKNPGVRLIGVGDSMDNRRGCGGTVWGRPIVFLIDRRD